MKKWVVDSDHSVAAFSIRHMMIARVHGQFNSMEGIIHFDPPDIRSASVELAIEAASVVTGIQKRDEHLRSPDFLDVGKYPKIIFKSSRIEPLGGSRAKVTGDLTIHGVTKQVTVEAEFAGPVKDPFEEGGISMGFSTSAVLNRDDYGITWNQPLENNGLMVGREVTLSIELEADLAK